MSAEKVIAEATKDLGYTESPAGSNKTKFGAWYGLNGYPWCVMALAYWFDIAGERSAFFGGGKTASCGTLLSWYQQMGQTVPVAEVRAGDIVILNFSGTKDTQHCGLVIDKLSNGYIATIEGNTTPGLEGSQDNGGSVAKKYRRPSQVVGVCRPQYKPEEIVRTDYNGHWAENAIKYVVSKGYMQGYTDGSFKPDNPITRAEIAQVIYNMEAKK